MRISMFLEQEIDLWETPYFDWPEELKEEARTLMGLELSRKQRDLFPLHKVIAKMEDRRATGCSTLPF